MSATAPIFFRGAAFATRKPRKRLIVNSAYWLPKKFRTSRKKAKIFRIPARDRCAKWNPWLDPQSKEFDKFIGKEMRLSQVEHAPKSSASDILGFYMGKNTPERKDYIMENLVVPVED